MPTPARTDRPRTRQADAWPPGVSLRATQARTTGKGAVTRAHAAARLRTALSQALGAADALELLIAEIGQPTEWAGGVRQGDAPGLLAMIADHLAATLETGESLHALGDQRFAIVRPGGLGDADRRCGRLLVELRRPLASHIGRRVVPEAALGAARLEAGTDPAEGLRRALAALQAARAEGPGAVVWHHPLVDECLRLRHELLRELPTALQRAPMALLLEPTVCLRSGAVIGSRAQLRWPHPRLGLVGAGELHTLARETGTTRELERYVLTQVLEHLRTGLAAGSRLPVTVPLSAASLAEDFFVERLRDACAQARVPATLLRIELRQDGNGPAPELLRRCLHEMSAAGIEAVIGDVNRWHLPLQHLLGIPLAGVECSVTWARDQLSEPRARAALGALVRVGHALGGSVGASGADTAEDLAWLRELRFDHARGAACGAPMLAADFLPHARACNAAASRIDPHSI